MYGKEARSLPVQHCLDQIFAAAAKRNYKRLNEARAALQDRERAFPRWVEDHSRKVKPLSPTSLPSALR
jgi:hypothetical protein